MDTRVDTRMENSKMETTITLPSGGWVKFRERHTITERVRRPVKDALETFTTVLMSRLVLPVEPANPDPTPEQVAAAEAARLAAFASALGSLSPAERELNYAANEAVALGLIVDASFGDLLDGVRLVTSESLLDLPAVDYDALLAAAVEYRDWFIGLDTSPSPDPDSPTGPSSD